MRTSVPPPLIVGVPFGAGCLLNVFSPLRMSPGPGGLAAGLACILGGAWLLAATAQRFRRRRTSMLPNGRVRALIDDGPFRFTRNPAYVGLLLLYAGVALVLDLPWALMLLPAAAVLLHFLAVLPEERRLEAQLGDAYRDYRRRVRRWL